MRNIIKDMFFNLALNMTDIPRQSTINFNTALLEEKLWNTTDLQEQKRIYTKIVDTKEAEANSREIRMFQLGMRAIIEMVFEIMKKDLTD